MLLCFVVLSVTTKWSEDANSAFGLVGAGLAIALFMAVGKTGDDASGGEGASLTMRCLCEFVAVFLLTLTVGLNVLTVSAAPAMSIGSTLAVLVYAFGPISGAHINPAVTLAVLLCGGDNRGISGIREAAFYIVAQLFGGV